MASPLHVGTWTRPSMFAALVLALVGSAALVTSVFVGGDCDRKRERVEPRTMRCGDGPRRHHDDHQRRVRPDRDAACRQALHDLRVERQRHGHDAADYIERRDVVLRACIVR